MSLGRLLSVLLLDLLDDIALQIGFLKRSQITRALYFHMQLLFHTIVSGAANFQPWPMVPKTPDIACRLSVDIL